MKQGFTLIELLVVVLVIGILSAVALPQYQTAVARSRYQQMVVLTSAIINAQKIYYMANGSYTADFDSLDIAMPAPRSVQVKNADAGLAYEYYYDWGSCVLRDYSLGNISCANYSSSVPSLFVSSTQRICYSNDSKPITTRVCRLESGLSEPSSQLDQNTWRWEY